VSRSGAGLQRLRCAQSCVPVLGLACLGVRPVFAQAVTLMLELMSSIRRMGQGERRREHWERAGATHAVRASFSVDVVEPIASWKIEFTQPESSSESRQVGTRSLYR
jgi:hypothetical protein